MKGSNKKIGARVGESVCMCINGWFKPILLLFLTWLFRKWKIVIHGRFFYPPPQHTITSQDMPPLEPPLLQEHCVTDLLGDVWRPGALSQLFLLMSYEVSQISALLIFCTICFMINLWLLSGNWCLKYFAVLENRKLFTNSVPRLLSETRFLLRNFLLIDGRSAQFGHCYKCLLLGVHYTLNRKLCVEMSWSVYPWLIGAWAAWHVLL